MQGRGHLVLVLAPLSTHGVSGTEHVHGPMAPSVLGTRTRFTQALARGELQARQERRLQPMVTGHSLVNYQRAKRDQMPTLLESLQACWPREDCEDCRPIWSYLLCSASHLPSGHR